jgi:hypothetical protein
MTRRRVTAGTIGLAAVLGLSLGACATDNTPDEYNTLTQQNFLEGCTNYYFENSDDTLAITDNTVEADVTAPDQDACQCMYEVFQDNMPINSAAADTIPNYSGPNFTDFNGDVKDDPQSAWDSLPSEYKDAINDCSDGTSSSSSTTSTTAGDDTTTTAG